MFLAYSAFEEKHGKLLYKIEPKETVSKTIIIYLIRLYSINLLDIYWVFYAIRQDFNLKNSMKLIGLEGFDIQKNVGKK